MKLSLCIEIALAKLPFEQRFEKAAELGFEFVEMWFVKDFSYHGTAEKLAKIVERNNVKMTNSVIGSPDGSIGGGLTDPAKRKQWLERARITIEFNKAANIPATIICTGNVVKGMSDRQMLQSVIEGLKPTLDMAVKAGVTLLLEPLNTVYDHPGYWLSSSDKAAAICRKLDCPNMKLLFDCELSHFS